MIKVLILCLVPLDNIKARETVGILLSLIEGCGV